MGRNLAAGALLLLAGTSLSGCIAAAIPALASSAMAGSRVIKDGSAAEPVPAPAPARVAASVPVEPPPAATATASAPVVAAAAAPVAPDPVPAPAVAAAAVPAVPTPPPLAAEPDESPAPAADRSGFAGFVRYGEVTARTGSGKDDMRSAILSDPVALDGARRPCAAGVKLIAAIDLDPAEGIFTPPARIAQQSNTALGLALLREAGVEIAWFSDLPIEYAGLVRAALAQAGLDERGVDILSLRREGEEGKQERREKLAEVACIIAIAGDERADFDERFKYLRNPEDGAGLEPLIGDGWFLLPPLFGN